MNVRRPLATAAVAALALAAGRLALATDAPHNAANLPNTCKDCHVLHSAPGAQLTKDASNANLCLSCHQTKTNPTVANWQTGDQATPGTSGSSHRWDAAAVTPAKGATPPTNATLLQALANGTTLQCSTCHDQHTQANAPFDPTAPATAGSAGRHFQAIANGGAQMCLDCHAQWNFTNVGSGTPYACPSGGGCSLVATGTATFSTTSTTVSGSGNWVALGVKPGWRVKKVADPVTAFTTIQSVGTSLTLVQNYGGGACGTPPCGGTSGTNVAWEAAPPVGHPSSKAVTGTKLIAPPNDTAFYGKATGGSTTSVTVDGSTNTGFVWATNALSSTAAPRFLRFTSGTFQNLVCQITGNQTVSPTTTISITPFGAASLPTAPASGTTFEMGRVTQTTYGTATAAGTTTTIVDGTKAGWPSLSGLTVTMVAGSAANVGKTSTIQGISAGTITVSPAFSATATAAGDVYRINWPSNDTGVTASGTTTTVLTDSVARGWAANSLKNLTVRFTTHGPPNATQGDIATYYDTTRTITANGTNTITLSSAVTGIAATGNDTYEIAPAQVDLIRGTATAAGTTSRLYDSTKGWTTSSPLVGLSIRFLGPNGQGVVGAGNQGTVSTLTAVGNGYVDFVAVTSATAVGDAYEVDQDGNITNNLALAGASATSFTAGNVVCLSCHGAHFADSSSSTYDAAPPATLGAGDGKLLRRDNGDAFCSSCHAVKVHSAANTSTKYGAWGADFTCSRCHQPHETTNLYLMKQQIVTPNSGTKTVDFRNTSGTVNSFASGTGTGPCEVCHTKTEDPTSHLTRYRNTGSQDTGHNLGGTCSGCHKHETGFQKPSSGSGESGGGNPCAACHGAILDGMDGASAKASKHTLVVASDSTTEITQSWTGLTNLTDVVPANRQCINMCHSDHPHDISNSTHEWNVYLDATTTTTRSNGAANNGTTTRDNTDFDGSATNGGMCVSCHQTRVDATKPAVTKAAYAASAHNTTTAFGTSTPWSYKLHDGGVFLRNCTKCHADPGDANPQTTATGVGAVHYSTNPQLLGGTVQPNNAPANFVCYKCHGNGTTGTNLSGKPIATEIAYTFSHPVNSDNLHDTAAEPPSATSPNTKFSGANRHVNCIDCHDEHQTQAVASGAAAGKLSAVTTTAHPYTLSDTTSGKAWTVNQWRGYTIRMTSGAASGQTSAVYGNTANTLQADFYNAPAVNDTYVLLGRGLPGALSPPAGTQPPALTGSPVLTGAWGVVPTFTAPPSPPGYNDHAGCGAAGTSHACDPTTAPAQFSGVSTYAVTSGAPAEAYVCLKCHSSYAYGTALTSLPESPSRQGNATSSAWSDTISSALMHESDIASDFNPGNLAHHAVFARGKNQPIRANYGGQTTAYSVYNTNWPAYASGGASLSVTNGAATIGGSGLPVTALPGWFIYVGATTPPAGRTTGAAASGYLEISAIADANHFTVRGETSSGGWYAPTGISSTSWFATAGLGNTFVPPWGPWSVIACTDCHRSSNASDPFGPHGSSTKWMLRNAVPQQFAVWTSGTPTTVTTVSWSSASSPALDATDICVNCHRRDVYGDTGLTVTPRSPVAGAPYTYSRQYHPADYNNTKAIAYRTKWGNVCMGCHGGARQGSIHGENLGLAATASGGTPASYSGRRLLGGGSWSGITRSTTGAGGKCYVKSATDAVDNCGAGHLPQTMASPATYSYEDDIQ
jgi:predicted CXXCH cytochrome family protein